jgi:hypothetical protein
MSLSIHYAYQLCDIANREHDKRYCETDRTTLSKKSVRSFVNSVHSCALKHSDVTHFIKFFSDRSTADLISFVNNIIEQNTFDNIVFEIEHLNKPGICNSIKECYVWLIDAGKDLVYQVQDDYLFTPSCITELYEMQGQLYNEIGEFAILSPFNDFWLWLGPYRNRPTPRTIICSTYRYWIQYYDMSCSFLTHHNIFKNNIDLYNEFFRLLDLKSKELENISLNYMLTRRGLLGLVPINNLAFHVQSELEKDPYIDWKPYWDNTSIT